MKYGFGVDLGGTTVKLAYFDETGMLLDKWEIPTNTSNEGSRILPDIAESILRYLDTNRIPGADILGIGIGVPGPVSPRGVVNSCVNLGWGVLNVEQFLSSLTGFPVRAGNDANLAALGECWQGSGRGCSNMVMVTLGTGVGAGIILDGRVVFGARGAAGEVGHIVINPDEPEPHTSGKRGCAEQYCSATGIVRLAKSCLSGTAEDSVLRQFDPLTCKDIFDAGNAGDAAALAILEQFYEILGAFLANLCDVLDPEAIVLGGGVSKAGQVLLDGIRPHFQKHVFHAIRDVNFVLASLGNDAGAYGAFRLALQSFGK